MLIISHRSHHPAEIGTSTETNSASSTLAHLGAALAGFFHRLVALAQVTPNFHDSPEQRIERAGFMAHRDQVRSETYFH